MDPITFALGVASSIVAAVIYDMAKSKLRSNQFTRRSKHLPQSKSIFSVAKNKIGVSANKIMPGLSDASLLNILNKNNLTNPIDIKKMLKIEKSS